MARDRANIFIVHTPFQMLMAEAVATLLSSESAEDHLVTTFELPNVSPRWTSHRVISVNGAYKRSDARKALSLAKTVFRQIGKTLRPVLISTNLEHPIVNPFYLEHTRRSEHEFEILSEGLLNMLPPRITWWQKCKWSAKWILRRLSATPYAFYNFDIAGTECATRIYALVKPLLRRPLQVVFVDPRQLRAPVMPAAGVMILGQPLQAFYSGDDLRRLWESLALTAEVTAPHVKLYKPHHYESTEAKEYFRRRGYEIVEDRRPVEILFKENPVYHVVAVSSSALVHLKRIYGVDIRCTAFRPLELYARTDYQLGTPEELVELFVSNGVEVTQ